MTPKMNKMLNLAVAILAFIQILNSNNKGPVKSASIQLQMWTLHSLASAPLVPLKIHHHYERKLRPTTPQRKT